MTPLRKKRFSWCYVAGIDASLLLLTLGLRSLALAGTPSGSGRQPQYNVGPMLARFLQGPMAEVEEIAFAVRVPGKDHWYVNFGYYLDRSAEPAERAQKDEDGLLWGYGDGGRLCRFNLRTGKLTVLLDDPAGGRGKCPPWARLLPELLRPLGYRSYRSGKRHVDGNPLECGFDRSFEYSDTDHHFLPAQRQAQIEPPLEPQCCPATTTPMPAIRWPRAMESSPGNLWRMTTSRDSSACSVRKYTDAFSVRQ
jgi:hypothetical protein